MNESAPAYESSDIEIWEWPQPCCEIVSKIAYGHIHIREASDAKAVIESLTRFLESIGESV